MRNNIVKHFLTCLCFISFSSFGQIKFNLNDAIPVTKYGNPLPNTWAGGINFPRWSEIDLNQDGKKDLFMFDRSDNRVIILMNDGSAGPQAFHFDSNSVKYAAMFPLISSWAFLYDYNADSLPDLFTLNSQNSSSIIQYKASFNAGKWIFTAVDSIMLAKYGSFYTNIGVGQNNIPAFDDIDGDGDMDVIAMVYNCNNTFAYYKNYSMEDTGKPDSLNDYKVMTNSWGSFYVRGDDFRPAGYCYEETVFPINCPLVKSPDKSGYEMNTMNNSDPTGRIVTIDLDGDGDKDGLVSGRLAHNITSIYNTGNKDSASITSRDTLFPSYDVPVNLSSYTNASYVDVNNDGKKDLIVGNDEHEDRKGVWYYRNDSTTAKPHFKFQNDSLFQWGMIDVGEAASPVFFDADNDGLLDLIIAGIYNSDNCCNCNAYKSALTLYRNTGTAAQPAFQFVTNDYGGLSALSYPLMSSPYYPAFGDVDCDGKKDMIVGGYDGKLMFFKNIAALTTDSAIFQFPPVSNYMGIDVGNNATPQLIDLDNDSYPDLVIGEKNGTLNYFHNNGSCSSPFSITPVDTFGGVDVHFLNYTDGYSIPYIFKEDGKFKLLVSCMQGNVLLYENVDTTTGSTFTFVDTILQKNYGNRYGYGISVSGGDIDGDGDDDMVLGLYGGGVQIYYADFPPGISEVTKPKIFFDVYPNPVSETLNLNIHRSPKADEVYLLSVFNSIGEVVYSQKVSYGNHSIDTKRFSNGIYLVQLRTNEQSVSARVVVSH